tara:strand:+ start:1011 stop:1382 length:372 start_codon:yes stop_codon:yes gene_type:complete
MKTQKNKKGGSRTKIYHMDGKNTIPITRKEMKKKKKINKMNKMNKNSNNSKKNFLKRLYNKVFPRKKSFKISPILVPATQNFKTRKSNTSSSQKRKIQYYVNTLPPGAIGYNIKDGYIYAQNK